VVWPDATAVIVGRNMDFHEPDDEPVDTAARHLERDGVNGALTWTSKYGSVVAGAFDMISVDGLNEAGLAGHVLWLAESDYDATGDSCIIENR
jgi:choloylglycine hydrolase